MTNKLSPTALMPTVTLALYGLTGDDTTKVVSTDELVAAVCSSLGITQDAWGIVESQASKPQWTRYNIIRSARAVRSAGNLDAAGRGRYRILPAGIEKAKELTPQTTAAPTATTTATATATTVVEEPVVEAPIIVTGAGVSFNPSLGDIEDTYSDDEYLISLAVDSVKCFGFYSSRSSMCKACPIAKSCKKAWLVDLATMAQTLDVRDTTPEPEPEPVVEEPVVEEAPVEEPVETNRVEIGPDNLPEGANLVTLPAEVVCSKCGQKMEAGTTAVWEFGKGSYHTLCP